MTTHPVVLDPQLLSAERWHPFGWLPLDDANPDDGVETLYFDWADPHINLIHHSLDEVAVRPDGLVCDQLFRHLTHTQALLVLNVESVMVVAPPGTEFSAPGSQGRLSAFWLRPGDSFVLHRGTWHWGPFPATAERVDLYNIQGRRYAEDNDCQPLSHLGEFLCGRKGP